MTAIIKHTPLYGTKTEGPFCSLLEIDDYRILLDCGWDDRFDTEVLESLRSVVASIDAVLLSQPDLLHLGALPLLAGKWGLKAKVYATIPIFKMGQMFLYDAYESKRKDEDFDVWNLDDVDAAFSEERFEQLKYSQHVHLKGRGAGIELTPYVGGHMLGGTVWRIVKETEEILYAVDYNHKKERHLNPTVLETLNRPTLLITDAFNALTTQSSRRARDVELIETTMTTLKNEGNVLLPTDTAGRVLELLLTLDKHWAYYRLTQYGLVLLDKQAYNTIEFAKSQLEWMSASIQNDFERERVNPFEFKFVRLCHSREELNSLPKPAVVLATTASLEWGFARDLFVEWASNPRHTVIFTDRPQPGTLAHQLLTMAPRVLELELHRCVPLEGSELREWRTKQQEERMQKLLEEQKKKQEEMKKDEGDEQDEENEVSLLFHTTAHSFNVFKENCDWFAPKSNGNYYEPYTCPIFPHEDIRQKFDDYGQTIDLQHFLHPPTQRDFTADSLNARGEGGIKMETDSTGGQVERIEVEATPTKYIKYNQKVEVKCPIKYIDFEGRSDGRSIKTILGHVAPRKMILLHGSPEAMEHLRDHCTSAQVCSDVYAPDDNETLDLTSDTNIYQVKLKEALLKTLEDQFVKVGDREVAYINGVLNPTGFGNQADGMELEQAPIEAIPPHNPVFVGEVRLSDFKEILTRHGFRTEFAAGVLICNGVVMLRKETEGLSGRSKISVHGTLCDDYFAVRELLYSQFHIL